MRIETHLEAFEERRDTLLKWALEVRGLARSQRIIGDNACRAAIELLSAYLHKEGKIEEGFHLNHRWFKSAAVGERLPVFQNKQTIVSKLVELELLCEKLAYGAPRPADEAERALALFNELEAAFRMMMPWWKEKP